jgi:hypothetical protein
MKKSENIADTEKVLHDQKACIIYYRLIHYILL